MRIKKIEFTGKKIPMTDITVEKNHNFLLANGILSHNSWEEATRKQDSSAFGSMMEFIGRMMPQHPSETLFTDGFQWLKFTSEPPSFWSDEVSRSYKKWDIDAAIAFIEEAMDAGMRINAIETQLAIRGFKKLTRAEIRRAFDDPAGMKADWEQAK